jgi:hypothetical protein
MTTPYYQHTQVGYVILGGLGLGVAFCLVGIGMIGIHWALGLATIAMIVCLVLFPSLTVTIDTQTARIHFGAGIIRHVFLVQDIAACRMVKNPWYYGWGIHLTPSGWLYNVSGFDAIELEMKNGKRHRIGTDDPQGLLQAIQQALHT